MISAGHSNNGSSNQQNREIFAQDIYFKKKINIFLKDSESNTPSKKDFLCQYPQKSNFRSQSSLNVTWNIRKWGCCLATRAEIFYFFFCKCACVHIYIDICIYNSRASVCKIQSYSHLLHLVTMKKLTYPVSQRSCNCLDLSKLCLL